MKISELCFLGAIGLGLLALIGGLMFGVPTYRVWTAEQEGRAMLAKANYAKEAQVADAFGMGPFPAPHRLDFCGGLFCPSFPARGTLFRSSGFGSSATTARSRGDRGHRDKPSQGH
jgi:hypothetical protein